MTQLKPLHCDSETFTDWIKALARYAGVEYSGASMQKTAGRAIIRASNLVEARSKEREFTDAVINAIGEISVAECQAAIAKWRAEHP